MQALKSEIRRCRLCAQPFRETKTQHSPKPVVWFDTGAKILIAGQAPGMRVHQSGIPFDDRSGDRLRDWMGVDRDVFYDTSKIAVVPMAFCFPGYDAKGSDIAPPKICAPTWRSKVMEQLPKIELTLLIGGYAQNWHFDRRSSVTANVAGWRDHAPRLYPLPHPSWRNNAFIRKHPWFAKELLPDLKTTISKVLS